MEELQAPPRPDEHDFAILELGPVVDGTWRVAVTHLQPHALIDNVPEPHAALT